MLSKDKISKGLRDYFSEKENIDLVYLFGSVATGNTHKFSDIDVAVLLNHKVENPLEYRLQMMTDLSKLFHIDYIDVLLLNEVSPRLRFESVQNGEAIFVKDEDKRVDFEVRARLEYFDIQPLLELQYQYMRERLGKGQFGAKLIEN